MGFLRGYSRALSLNTGNFGRHLSLVIADETTGLPIAILIDSKQDSKIAYRKLLVSESYWQHSSALAQFVEPRVNSTCLRSALFDMWAFKLKWFCFRGINCMGGNCVRIQGIVFGKRKGGRARRPSNHIGHRPRPGEYRLGHCGTGWVAASMPRVRLRVDACVNGAFAALAENRAANRGGGRSL